MAKYYIKLFNKYKTINNEQQINTIVVKLIKFLELKAYLTVLLNNSLLPFSQDWQQLKTTTIFIKLGKFP